MEAAAIAEVLGGRKTLGGEIRKPDDLARLVREGLPATAVIALARRLAVSSTELLQKLGIPRRTMTRRLSRHGRLTAAESDRAARLARVYASAVAMIGEEQQAIQWLATPNRALEGQRPWDQLDTDVGTREVEDLLGRIAYGVYS